MKFESQTPEEIPSPEEIAKQELRRYLDHAAQALPAEIFQNQPDFRFEYKNPDPYQMLVGRLHNNNIQAQFLMIFRMAWQAEGIGWTEQETKEIYSQRLSVLGQGTYIALDDRTKELLIRKMIQAGKIESRDQWPEGGWGRFSRENFAFHSYDLKEGFVHMSPEEHITKQVVSNLENATLVKAQSEAHEYGHAVRILPRFGALQAELRQGFAEPDQDHLEMIKAVNAETNPVSDEGAIIEIENYLFRSPEIIERMSQLKNYVGLSADQYFTKDHLDTARASYLRDVDFNNYMDVFLSLITPQTEHKFLELINTIGV